QPQPGVLDQLLTNPALFTQMKELGIFGGTRGDAATGEFDLKIEQLRSTNQLELRKLDLENRKMMLEIDAKDRRTDTLLSALIPFGTLIAGPINQQMMKLGQQQASAHNPVNPAGMSPMMPMPNTIQIRCSCGYQGPTSFYGDKPPAIINCPQCGQELNAGDVPIAGKPEETDTGT
ncbi:unnamed protein product, partial [marine sediment metagenome]